LPLFHDTESLHEAGQNVQYPIVELVGTDRKRIVNKTNKLLKEQDYYDKMSRAINPYGDGRANERIFEIVESWFS